MFLLVYITTGSKEEAEEIAGTLVKERLAACINYFPINSTYSWQGKIESSDEYLLLCKTTEQQYPRLEKQVKDIHPYDVPAIIALSIHTGSKEYLQWVKDSMVH